MEDVENYSSYSKVKQHTCCCMLGQGDDFLFNFELRVKTSWVELNSRQHRAREDKIAAQRKHSIQTDNWLNLKASLVTWCKLKEMSQSSQPI